MPADYTVFASLYAEFIFLSILVALFVFGWLAYTVLVHRQGVNQNANLEKLTPGTFPKERDNMKAELAWFIGPIILVGYMTFLAWGSTITMWANQPDPNAASTFDMDVTAYQWYWEFEYNEDMTWEETHAAPQGTITFTNGTEGVTVFIWESVRNEFANHTFQAEAGGDIVEIIDGSGMVSGESSNHRKSGHSVLTVSAINSNGDETILGIQHHVAAGFTSINEVWLPNEMDIVWHMNSMPIDDNPAVIHSAFPIEYANKEDLVPNIETTMFFTPQDVGDFEMVCAEYCGQQHSVMVAMMHVVDSTQGGVA
jgi:heme/copper-type cytochrome/quinol oxidase subunit 2